MVASVVEATDAITAVAWGAVGIRFWVISRWLGTCVRLLEEAQTCRISVLPSRPPNRIVLTFFLVGRWLDPSALLFGQLAVFPVAVPGVA